jgi:hypothetical protein
VFAVVALVALALAVHASGAWSGLAEGYEGDRTLAAAMATAHGLIDAGEPPLWDPAGAGAPLWTRGAELLYPPWWLLGRGNDRLWLPALAAAHAALACALAFRFLRAQGRSRYAAFVTGAAYGLGAQVGALTGNLAEFAALAWAPLPIEVFLLYARSEGRWLFGALLAPALALPFYTGGTVTAGCAATLVAFWMLRQAAHERHRRGSYCRVAAATVGVLVLLTAPVWLCQADAPGSPPPPPPLPDVGAALQRVAGPLLAFLVLLGLARRQRHTPAERWLPIAVGSIGFAVLLPFVPSPFAGPAPWHETPTALWWPVHLSLVLLAASGLDDFLDGPLRKRAATAWLLVSCTMIGPLCFLLGAEGRRFHLEAAVLLALAALFTCWRWLGILRFKTVLAAAAIVWLAAATLQEQAKATRAPQPVVLMPGATRNRVPATPGPETAAPPRAFDRARIVFELRPGHGGHGGAVLPFVPGAPTRVFGMPPTFVPRADATARVQRVRSSATAAEYLADLGKGQGALLVDETYARGWRATVDGEPAPVLRSDDDARVVLLGPGKHRIATRYRPLAAVLGPPLAAAGALVALLWLLGGAVVRLAARRR